MRKSSLLPSFFQAGKAGQNGGNGHGDKTAEKSPLTSLQSAIQKRRAMNKAAAAAANTENKILVPSTRKKNSSQASSNSNCNSTATSNLIPSLLTAPLPLLMPAIEISADSQSSSLLLPEIRGGGGGGGGGGLMGGNKSSRRKSAFLGISLDNNNENGGSEKEHPSTNRRPSIFRPRKSAVSLQYDIAASLRISVSHGGGERSNRNSIVAPGRASAISHRASAARKRFSYASYILPSALKVALMLQSSTAESSSGGLNPSSSNTSTHPNSLDFVSERALYR